MERLMRKQEYEREILRQRINEKMQKADYMQFEKSKLLEQRMLMKKQIGLEKQELLNKIELVKQGKLDPGLLSHEGSSMKNSKVGLSDSSQH